jgi:ribosomal protein S18 acetylase RimI-like enzyme
MRPASTTSPSPSTPPERPGAEVPRARFAAFAQPRLRAAGITLRAATAGDLALIATIYATTREEELRQTPWNEAQKKAFTDWQSRMQEEHYALHYPGAERLLVERDGVALGRIYVDTRAEVRLMDVTLLPAHRNRGIGTHLMHALLAYADALGRRASLHVEPFNPAKRMYERFGFGVAETRGLYELMVRRTPA